MPKKPKPFNTDKDVLEGKAVSGAPIVGGEFVTEDGDWQGQTVQVESDTHLEDDHGTGEHVIIRTYEFAANPLQFGQRTPDYQELFDSHKKGIAALLWQDGLTPVPEIDPKIVISKNQDRYFIMVTARPSLGQSVLDKSQTLSEIANEGKRHTNTLHGEL